MAQDQTCGNCRNYGLDDRTNKMVCKLNPPQVVDGSGDARWPIMLVTDSCEQWQNDPGEYEGLLSD